MASATYPIFSSTYPDESPTMRVSSTLLSVVLLFGFATAVVIPTPPIPSGDALAEVKGMSC